MSPIRVLIADDHPMFRFGLRAVILAEPDLELAGEAENGEDAVELVNALSPDVALLDLNMPKLDGIGATARIARESPRTGILILTMLEDDESVLAAIRCGARGYIVKGSGGEEIVRAIRGVAAGEVIFGPSVGPKVLSALQTPVAPKSDRPFSELTRREYEVLQLLALGQSNSAIAEHLFVSEKTVRNHLSLIFDKLGVRSRAEAIVLAHRNRMG
jgi:DNA-binding NarL/FixJ family response regulator